MERIEGQMPLESVQGQNMAYQQNTLLSPPVSKPLAFTMEMEVLIRTSKWLVSESGACQHNNPDHNCTVHQKVAREIGRKHHMGYENQFIMLRSITIIKVEGQVIGSALKESIFHWCLRKKSLGRSNQGTEAGHQQWLSEH